MRKFNITFYNIIDNVKITILIIFDILLNKSGLQNLIEA